MKKEEKINEIISSRYIERVYPSKEKLKKLLLSSKKLKLYIGFDPTGSELHLGHSTNFLLLKKFQELGHKVVLLVGDFTARVGDPSGRLDARKPLTEKEIEQNCKDYKEQISKILSFNNGNSAQLDFNSKWLAKLNLGQTIKLLTKMTVSQMLKRDMFKKRVQEKKEIYLNEFLYPLLQGYDSVAMGVDVEVGGNDQTFNMMVGRNLMKDYLKKEKIVIATRLLIRPSSQKKLMSKSEGKYISLKDSPDQMYGKTMALPDDVILTVFSLCTEAPDKEIESFKELLKKGEINYRDLKARLAEEIVNIYHGQEKAEKAQKSFDRVFKEKKSPFQIKEVNIRKNNINILDLLKETKKAASKSEAKRLVMQGAVEIDGILKKDWREKIIIKKGSLIKIGKKTFLKIA